MNRRERHRISVVTYHGVGVCPTAERAHDCLCMPTATFSAQVEFLVRHRQVISLADAVERRATGGAPAVAITFDDGYRNVLANAVPILARHGLPATVFVPTRWIGAVNSWDEGRNCFPLDIMDAAELREAERRGMTVESHGHQHIDLRTLGPEAVADDLRQSMVRLQEVCGRRPRYLAYPYGGHSPSTRIAAEAAGFWSAFGFNQLDAGTYGKERLSLDGGESRTRLRLKTSGGYLARRQSRWGTLAGSAVRCVVRRPDHG